MPTGWFEWASEALLVVVFYAILCASSSSASTSSSSSSSSALQRHETQDRKDVGKASHQGQRKSMEDRWMIRPLLLPLYAVMDGHNGPEAAEFVSIHWPRLFQIRRESTDESYPSSLCQSLVQTDQRFIRAYPDEPGPGSTVVAAFVDTANQTLHLLNLGDSRGVVCRGGQPVLVTVDHKPDRKDERRRIEQAGGTVSYHEDAWRVDQNLAMSRAIGHPDSKRRRRILCEPDVLSLPIQPKDDVLILASDGLWDQVSVVDACAVITRERGLLMPNWTDRAAQALVNLAGGPHSDDNVSVLIVPLSIPFSLSVVPPSGPPLSVSPASSTVHTCGKTDQ